MSESPLPGGQEQVTRLRIRQDTKTQNKLELLGGACLRHISMVLRPILEATRTLLVTFVCPCVPRPPLFAHAHRIDPWPLQPALCLPVPPTPCHLHLPVVGVEAVNQLDDVPGGIVEVRDGREGVQAGGMELVAILHRQLGEALEVLLLDTAGHLLHALRHNGLSPELQGERASERVSERVGGWS